MLLYNKLNKGGRGMILIVKKVCYNCGEVAWSRFDKECPACGHKFVSVNLIDGVKLGKMLPVESDKWIEEKSGHPLCENSKELRDAAYQRLHEECSRMNSKYVADKPLVFCPYCGSADTKKISTASRNASVAVVGVASSKIGKQWHCNKCKSDFWHKKREPVGSLMIP